MGVISFDSRARRWKADGSRAMSESDIWASTSPKRDSTSRSFWNVMASIVNSGGYSSRSHPPAPFGYPPTRSLAAEPLARCLWFDPKVSSCPSRENPGTSLARGTGASMGELRLGRCGRLLLLAPLARELLDAARGVDQALLPGEERVAVRADLQAQLLAFRGPRGPGRAARAVDVDRDVIRMNACLHDLSARRMGPPALGSRPPGRSGNRQYYQFGPLPSSGALDGASGLAQRAEVALAILPLGLDVLEQEGRIRELEEQRGLIGRGARRLLVDLAGLARVSELEGGIAGALEPVRGRVGRPRPACHRYREVAGFAPAAVPEEGRVVAFTGRRVARLRRRAQALQGAGDVAADDGQPGGDDRQTRIVRPFRGDGIEALRRLRRTPGGEEGEHDA